jgi:predicted molibdopterin-dependent oxidoreductase YjgC
MRIFEHPILKKYKKKKKFNICFNGKKITAYEGETIAAALWASGIKKFRTTPKYEEPRGVFCNRGRCTDCIMNVDGKPNVRTCVTIAKEGMVVNSLEGLGSWEDVNGKK